MQAQRTKLEAYRHVLQAYYAGILGAFSAGACAYRRGNRRCAVGCLFNDAQLEDLKARKLNAKATIGIVAGVIGKKNIEHVTGLSMPELLDLQNRHDRDADTGLGGDAPALRKGQPGTDFQKFLLRKIKRLEKTA